MEKGRFFRLIAICGLLAHTTHITYTPFAIAKTHKETVQSVDELVSFGESQFNQSMQSWGNQYGTAKIKTGYSLENDRFDPTSIDILMPFYESNIDLLFTQWGYRYEQGVDTLNFGVGYRTTYQDKLLGMNFFYDRDMKANHGRVGLGAEYFADFMRLKSNGYIRLSDWRDVDLPNDKFGKSGPLQARAANGFDVAWDTYLPMYPQLGFNLHYEQYFGNEVDLFKQNQLQADPHAMTFSINYTPIPLITWQLAHTEGKQGFSDTKGMLGLTYRFGVPLEQQLNPDHIRYLRTHQAGKLELVERNPIVTLQYRQKTYAQTPEIEAPEPQLSLHLEVVRDRVFANGIEYNQVKAILVQSNEMEAKPATDRVIRFINEKQEVLGVATTDEQGIALFNVSSTEPGLLTVIAVLVGDESQQAMTQLTFTDESTILQGSLTVKAEKTEALANGTDGVILIATLTDAEGKAVADRSISLIDDQAQVRATAKTDEQGKAEFKIATLEPGLMNLLAQFKLNQETLTSSIQTLFFKGDPNQASLLEIKILEDNAIANNLAENALAVRLYDKDNRLLPRVGLHLFDVNTPNTVLATVITDDNGAAQFHFSSAVAGARVIGASVIENPTITASQTLTFQAIPQSISMNVSTTPVLANGSDSHLLTAKVLDFNADPIADIHVNFVDESGAVLVSDAGIAMTGMTNQLGEISLPLTSQKATELTLYALIEGSTIRSELANIAFIADVSTAKIASIEPVNAIIAANGSETTELKIVVADRFDNRLAHYQGIMISDDRQTRYPGNPFTADERGEFSVPISPTDRAGILTVMARLGNGAIGSTEIEFIQNYTDAYISLNADKRLLLSNGVDTSILRGRLVDKYGYSIPNEPITITDSRGWQSIIERTDQEGYFIVTDFPSSELSLRVKAVVKMNQDPSVDAEVEVSFNGDLNTASLVQLNSDKSTMIANSDEVATLKAKVTDENGHPIINARVRFTQEGSLISEALSDAAGEATAYFQASVEDLPLLRPLGLYSIEASMININEHQSSMQTAILLVASDTDIRIDGIETLQAPVVNRPAWFEYLVKDRYGNPALVGQTMQYQIQKEHDNKSPVAITGVDYEFVDHSPINEHGRANLGIVFYQPGHYRVSITPPNGTAGILDLVVSDSIEL